MRPQAYENTSEPADQSATVPIQFNLGFLKDKHGILKIIEVRFSAKLKASAMQPSWSDTVHI